MTDSEIRELCHRFFDAYQDRRVDELAEIYAPDCVVWHNVFGRETSGQENLAALPESLARYALDLSSDGNRLTYTFHTERANIAALLHDLAELGIEFKDLQSKESSLEDIFVSLVRSRS